MRIFNSKHLPWFVFVCLAAVGACILYIGNFHSASLPSWILLPHWLLQKQGQHQAIGATPLGLAFGAISLAIFFFAALLRLRAKTRFWRAVTRQRLLRAHIWLTLLTIPLVILHSGFRLGGPMTTVLMAMYAIVMISGIYGLILQHFIPELMLKWLPAETVFEQIPYIRAQLAAAATKMRDSFRLESPKETEAGGAASGGAKTIAVRALAMISTKGYLSMPTARAKTAVGSRVTAETLITSAATHPVPRPWIPSGPEATATRPPQSGNVPAKLAGTTVPAADPASEAFLAGFIHDQILPYLHARNGRKLRLGNAEYANDTFCFVKLQVAPAYRTQVEEIQAWCDERRMLDLQTRLHRWLHSWLFIHVPFSFFLLVMTGWHAFEMLFSYG